MPRNTPPEDEFYIGYVPRMPHGIGRLMVRIAAALAALAVLAGLTLVVAQKPFERATFEYGQFRDFTGVIETKPYPALLVRRPAASGGTSPYSRYLLVAMGKHGADSCTTVLDGRHVTLRGSLIYRDNQTMIELLPGSIRQSPAGTPAEASEVVLGPVTLTGEIVDSKCYLGVMNPGHTKVHRDCAVRCISGGIPPAFITKDAFYLLTGSDGRRLNQEVLDIAGETIEVRGLAVRSGDTLILRAEPAAFRRVARNNSSLSRP